MKELDNFTCSDGTIWAPIFKDGENWIDYKGANVKFLPWSPTANEGPKCVMYISRLKVYFPLNCNRKNCFYCQMKENVIFKFRGYVHFAI